jgi:hypothetical protein
MPLPLFLDNAQLTAAQLNALVDKLNTVGQMADVMVPLFQEVIIDNQDFPGDTRWWYFAILHQADNDVLHYRHRWIGTGADARMYIGNNSTPVIISRFDGITDGTINLTPYSIPPGALYVVKVNVDRGAASSYRLYWLFERSY